LVAYAAGVLVARPLGALLGLALAGFTLGTGRGWIISAIGVRAVGAFLGCVALGALFGAGAGLMGGILRRIWPGAFRSAGWSVFQRPIRLFSRRREETGSVAVTPARPGFLRRRWPWLVGLPLLVILVAAFGAGRYLERVVDRRLDEAIAAADRDDPFWRIDDLMAHREAVPDEENSALVVAEALERMPENWPGSPSPPTGESNPPPSPALKPLGRLGETADNVRLDDATAEVLRDELKAYDEAVRLARTVADYRRGRHELQLGPTLLDTLLTETQQTRSVARLLGADAAIRVHDGDPDGALDSCRAMLGTARSIGDEPMLISQLVRFAIGLVAMNATRRVLGQGEPSDAALGRLQALILDELSQPLLLHAIRGERAIYAELFRRLGTGEVPISALGERAPSFDRGTPLMALGPAVELWFDHQLAVELDWMNDAVAIARRLAVLQPELWHAWEANIDRVRLSRFGKFTHTLPILMMPALAASGASHARWSCDLGATAILLAAERHRRKTGHWPASVADIDRSILPSAPVDPFSGHAFHMEHRDGRLFIYSIGPNHRDEHGEYDPKKWPKGGLDDIGAIGWDVPLRRRPSPPEDKASDRSPDPP
jgi:hypothetical protein